MLISSEIQLFLLKLYLEASTGKDMFKNSFLEHLTYSRRIEAFLWTIEYVLIFSDKYFMKNYGQDIQEL